MLNLNINRSSILDIEETNRTEVVDKTLYDKLNKITREIDEIINCILQKV